MMRVDAPYRLLEIDLTGAVTPLDWQGDEVGAYVTVRDDGRPVGTLWIERRAHPTGLGADALRARFAGACGGNAVAARLYADLLARLERPPTPAPSLTCAICTRNRPTMLRRCLESVRRARDAAGELSRALEIVVVDNAPPDDATARTVADYPDVRYAVEPVPGLDFARNRALAASRATYIAYFDDDTVVDRGWIAAFAHLVAIYPEAGGFTGAVLAHALDTEAQVRFEKCHGFFKGFERRRYGPALWGNALYPCGAGMFGTGGNMAFKVDLVQRLGGFDHALDTGPPLPATGDLDMFYRVLRSGHLLVYEPWLLVRHDHRRDMASLRHQYFTWGLGVAVFFQKHLEADPPLRARLRATRRWYVMSRIRLLAWTLLGRGRTRDVRSAFAELWGCVPGRFGAYERSQRRVAERRAAFGR
jgi:glycosyltransferase involved in cell wall biosynthesis